MVHIYVGLFMSLVLFASAHKEGKESNKLFLTLVQTIFGVVLVVLLLMTVLAYQGNKDVFLSIPFTEIYDSGYIEIDKLAKLSLVSGTGIGDVNEFVLSSDTKIDELSKWLDSTSKAVELYAQVGADIIYTRNLGVVDSSIGTDILDIINNWENTGNIPNPVTTYKFLCFYFEN